MNSMLKAHKVINPHDFTFNYLVGLKTSFIYYIIK